jgi:2-iminobutanoate/2-iminopropanoate deaminase
MDVPLSRTRTHDGWIFVSGQVGRPPETGVVSESFESQVRQAIENLRHALEAEGSTLNDVLKTTVFIRRAEDFAEMNEIYAQCFETPYPARSTIVTALARPELNFEIEAIAHSAER